MCEEPKRACSMDDDQLKSLIRQKLSELTQNLGFDAQTIDSEVDLYAEGLIDSLGLATLVSLIESETGLRAIIRAHSDIGKIQFSINSLSLFFAEESTEL